MTILRRLSIESDRRTALVTLALDNKEGAKS